MFARSTTPSSSISTFWGRLRLSVPSWCVPRGYTNRFVLFYLPAPFLLGAVALRTMSAEGRCEQENRLGLRVPSYGRRSHHHMSPQIGSRHGTDQRHSVVLVDSAGMASHGKHSLPHPFVGQCIPFYSRTTRSWSSCPVGTWPWSPICAGMGCFQHGNR